MDEEICGTEGKMHENMTKCNTRPLKNIDENRGFRGKKENNMEQKIAGRDIWLLEFHHLTKPAYLLIQFPCL